MRELHSYMFYNDKSEKHRVVKGLDYDDARQILEDTVTENNERELNKGGVTEDEDDYVFCGKLEEVLIAAIQSKLF